MPDDLTFHLVNNTLSEVSMAILNLDNLVINRTVMGINCSKCGGYLNPAQKGNYRGKIIMWVTLGKVKSKRYECAGCKKIYTVI